MSIFNKKGKATAESIEAPETTESVETTESDEMVSIDPQELANLREQAKELASIKATQELVANVKTQAEKLNIDFEADTKVSYEKNLESLIEAFANREDSEDELVEVESDLSITVGEEAGEHIEETEEVSVTNKDEALAKVKNDNPSMTAREVFVEAVRIYPQYWS